MNPVILGLLLLSSVLTTATAQELRLTASDRQALSLTIYNAGRALVREQRLINSESPVSRIAFMDVAEQIMPQTVAFDGIDVREQNYDFDLLSPQSLVAKNIGQRVKIARRSTQSGENLEWLSGKILAANNGIILQMDDGSLEVMNGQPFYHMVFEQIPENLRTSPTLSLLLKSPLSAEQSVGMTYLTEGISWRSDYVLQLSENNSAALDNWVTINNDSGVDFDQAHLQLLAGDVNMNPPQPRMLMEFNRAMVSSAGMDVSEQALQGYHLYSVPFKTTLLNRQSKQIKLFSRDEIRIGKKLFDRAYLDPRATTEVITKPMQMIVLENREPALGLPLPQGTIRVYARDDSGNNQFIGEDAIKHTAVNDKVELNLGRSFDVSVTRKTLRVVQHSKQQQIITREIRLNNGSDTSQQIDLHEVMPTQQWSIQSASLFYDQPSPGEAHFKVDIPAKQQVVLSYEVLLNYP